MALFAEKADLRLPGPTAIPPQVERAMQATWRHPMMDYRNPEFAGLLRETCEKARAVFGTSGDVVLLAGSGTSALETAMVNVAGPGETVVLCVAGFFGEYFAGIAQRRGLRVVRVEAAWGEPIPPEAVARALRDHPEARAVFVTHSETSTGVLNPIDAIAAVVREHGDALVVVDAVSSLGGTPVEMDRWGIDVVASCSQKALMLPPGLALVALGERAWQVIRRRQAPSFYFDLRQYEAMVERGAPPYTPNVALVAGLREALRLMEQEGLPNVYRRHRLLQAMTRSAVQALGWQCAAPDGFASPTLTSVRFEFMDADAFRAVLRQRMGVAVGGGLGPWRGRVLRLGHMGYCDAGDVLKMVAALEAAAAWAGLAVPLGAGVEAAQRVWLDSVQESTIRAGEGARP
ncbi:MAG TPA: alanine--glyoxylate aminotransferase family protein [Limnochordales bacterium]